MCALFLRDNFFSNDKVWIGCSSSNGDDYYWKYDGSSTKQYSAGRDWWPQGGDKWCYSDADNSNTWKTEDDSDKDYNYICMMKALQPLPPYNTLSFSANPSSK